MGLHRFASVGALAAALGLIAATSGCATSPVIISVSPQRDLVDGQVVTVTGAGYAPNSSLGMVQCVAGADSIDDCDGRTATSFSADANGGFSKPLTVHRVIRHNVGQETDCAEPDACVVASVYIHGFQGPAFASLHFAG